MKSYRELDIYTLSYDLAAKIHKMSLKLPKYETYEAGSLNNVLVYSCKSCQKK